MAEVTVNIFGKQKGNTTGVRIGDHFWGENYAIQFGQMQPVEAGKKELTVYKTSFPTTIMGWLIIPNWDAIVNITVDLEKIHVDIIEVNN